MEIYRVKGSFKAIFYWNLENAKLPDVCLMNRNGKCDGLGFGDAIWPTSIFYSFVDESFLSFELRITYLLVSMRKHLNSQKERSLSDFMIPAEFSDINKCRPLDLMNLIEDDDVEYNRGYSEGYEARKGAKA